MNTRVQSKRVRRVVHPKELTGTNSQFFLGGAWTLEGFWHVKPPRWSPAYEKMTVTEIARRVRDDIEELVARAYPTYGEEWAKKHAPAWWRDSGVPHDKRCHHIDEKFANLLRRGLWERLNSQKRVTAKKAYKELTDLLQKHDEAEPKHAATNLALIARDATARLENLSQKRSPLMREVAKEFESWPVNMGVELKVSRGKIIPKVTGSDFAKDYLVKLGVNLPSRPSGGDRNGTRPQKRFRAAACSLHEGLVMMRRDPKFWFKRMTPWAKDLLSLSEPMTKANWGDWWKLAKVWVDEQWETNRESFLPLIARRSKLDPVLHTPSMVKSQVIDDGLKKAFKGLAIPVEQ